jgi:hypothetical protein
MLQEEVIFDLTFLAFVAFTLRPSMIPPIRVVLGFLHLVSGVTTFVIIDYELRWTLFGVLWLFSWSWRAPEPLGRGLAIGTRS